MRRWPWLAPAVWKGYPPAAPSREAFRPAPAAGAVPAAAYSLGIAFALALLSCGGVRCWQRHCRSCRDLWTHTDQKAQ